MLSWITRLFAVIQSKCEPGEAEALLSSFLHYPLLEAWGSLGMMLGGTSLPQLFPPSCGLLPVPTFLTFTLFLNDVVTFPSPSDQQKYSLPLEKFSFCQFILD